MLTLLFLAMAVQAPVQTIYGLSVNASGEMSKTVFVNGFQVHQSTQKAGEIGSSSLAVNDLIKNGKNTVEMVVGEVSPGGTKKSATALKVVLRLETDKTTDGSDVETALIREAKFEAPAGTKLPHTVRFEVTVKTDKAPGAWTRGAKLVMSDALVDEVVAEEQRIVSLIEKRDWDAYGDALALRYEQTARFYPFRGTVEEVRKEDLEQSRGFFSSKELVGFVPFDRAKVVCALRAEGRAVECTRRGESSLIQYMAAGDPRPMDMPLTFSRIDGRLVVVR